jgi:hypothetical protein
MLTDGLALSPDDWIFWAIVFCATDLATWSPIPRMARTRTMTTVSTIGQRLRLRRTGPRPPACCPWVALSHDCWS